VLARYPALRWHERYLGVLKEQRNLKGNVKEKGQRKTLLWEVFGEYIISNLKRNIKIKEAPEGYFQCRLCGKIRKKQTDMQIICNACSNEINNEFIDAASKLEEQKKAKQIKKIQKSKV
jgi:hypothetical protein